MRLSVILVLMLLTLSHCTSKKDQLKEMITGTWVLDEMKINKSVSTAEKMGNPQYQFHDDGKYFVFHAGQDEEGTWEVSEDSIISMKSLTYSDKPAQEYKVVGVSEERLVYRTRSGKWRVQMTLKKY